MRTRMRVRMLIKVVMQFLSSRQPEQQREGRVCVSSTSTSYACIDVQGNTESVSTIPVVATGMCHAILVTHSYTCELLAVPQSMYVGQGLCGAYVTKYTELPARLGPFTDAADYGWLPYKPLSRSVPALHQEFAPSATGSATEYQV